MPYTNIYRYRLISIDHNSQRYGNCEICEKPCSEVFIQTKSQLFSLPLASHHPQDPEAPKGYGWAVLASAFGHQECLETKQHGLRLPLTLEQFNEHFCTGREYDSCRNSPCQHSGEVCQHPLHPANWKQHEPDDPAC